MSLAVFDGVSAIPLDPPSRPFSYNSTRTDHFNPAHRAQVSISPSTSLPILTSITYTPARRSQPLPLEPSADHLLSPSRRRALPVFLTPLFSNPLAPHASTRNITKRSKDRHSFSLSFPLLPAYQARPHPALKSQRYSKYPARLSSTLNIRFCEPLRLFNRAGLVTRQHQSILLRTPNLIFASIRSQHARSALSLVTYQSLHHGSNAFSPASRVPRLGHSLLARPDPAPSARLQRGRGGAAVRPQLAISVPVRRL